MCVNECISEGVAFGFMYTRGTRFLFSSGFYGKYMYVLGLGTCRLVSHDLVCFFLQSHLILLPQAINRYFNQLM